MTCSSFHWPILVKFPNKTYGMNMGPMNCLGLQFCNRNRSSKTVLILGNILLLLFSCKASTDTTKEIRFIFAGSRYT